MFGFFGVILMILAAFLAYAVYTWIQSWLSLLPKE